jgi:intracellular sulfur oxidation DsrE/DsrF family protein
MKIKITLTLIFIICVLSFSTKAQTPTLTRIYPGVKTFGGIFDIPYAAEKPDPSMDYNIIVEVEKESEKPDTISWALHNVARLVNLHLMGGVPVSKINVVIAIHGGATYTAMNNESYKAKYKVDNPNLKLYEELQKAGVKMVICGQSLITRKVDRTKLVPQVKIATSMLTTLTTYQLKGYAYLKF